MPPTPGPGEWTFIIAMFIFVFFGEKIPRIADAIGNAGRDKAKDKDAST
ncbi:MAG: hypothetical protein Q8Q09_02640 [Deltaproteobacteria bacterium]|nr:hypothetical protein [Deltaproteobacteria bacterium]